MTEFVDDAQGRTPGVTGGGPVAGGEVVDADELERVCLQVVIAQTAPQFERASVALVRPGMLAEFAPAVPEPFRGHRFTDAVAKLPVELQRGFDGDDRLAELSVQVVQHAGGVPGRADRDNAEGSGRQRHPFDSCPRCADGK
jgi:hypothetical protein